MLAENLAAVERGGKDRMGLGAVLNAARADLSDGELERSDEFEGAQAYGDRGPADQQPAHQLLPRFP